MTEETKEVATSKGRLATLVPENEVSFCHDHIAGVSIGFHIDKEKRVLHLAASFCHKRSGKKSIHKIDPFSKSAGRLRVRGRLTSSINAIGKLTRSHIPFPFSYAIDIPAFYSNLNDAENLAIELVHKYLDLWRASLGLKESRISPVTYRDISFTVQNTCTNDQFFQDMATGIEDAYQAHVMPKPRKKEEAKA